MDVVNATDHELQSVRWGSRNRCLVYSDWDTPPGTSPPVARIGFENMDGYSRVVVDHCNPGPGLPASVSDWLSSGELYFDNFDEVLVWIRGDLTDAFGGRAPPPANGAAPVTRRRRRPEDQQDHGADEPDAAVAAAARPERPGPAARPGRRGDDAEEQPDLDPVFISADTIAAEVNKEVIGQPEAVRTLCRAAARHLAKSQPRRPITVLCVGPTGVGKTSSAEHLSTALSSLTEEDWGFVRIDCDEFQESHTTSRLFGAPPGYVGYGDESPLMKTLREHRRSVVLVDEVDKAHDNVFKAFLSLMDAGRASDSRGEVDAKSSLMLFTSNHLRRSDDSGLGFARRNGSNEADPGTSADTLARERLRKMGVLPELVGRINRVAVFGQLTQGHRLEIAVIAARRAASEYGIEVTAVDDSIAVRLAASDVRSGGRSIEASADEYLGEPLAEAAVEGATKIRLFDTDDGPAWERVAAEETPDLDPAGPPPSGNNDNAGDGDTAGGAAVAPPRPTPAAPRRASRQSGRGMFPGPQSSHQRQGERR